MKTPYDILKSYWPTADEQLSPFHRNLIINAMHEYARYLMTEQYIADKLADKMHFEITAIEVDTVKKVCDTVANHFKKQK